MIKNKNIAPDASIDGSKVNQSGFDPEGLTLASAKILVGDSNGEAAPVDMSGDATISNTGALTIAAGAVEDAMVASQALDGEHVKDNADDATSSSLLVVHAIAIGAGAAADHDVTVDHKIKVIDAWAQHEGGAGEANDTIQVKSGANAITDAMSWAGADNAIVRATTIDDANATIAASGTLRVTTTDDDSGTDVGAGTCYVLCVRVA